MRQYYKILIAFTALFITVACQKDPLADINPNKDSNGKIGYFTSVMNTTKATESKIAQLQSDGFKISTFVKEGDGSYDSYYTDFVDYKDNNWSSGVERYWPQPDTRTLDMFSYSPLDKDFIVENNATDRSTYSLTYTSPYKPKEQVDLLVNTLTNQSHSNHFVKEGQANTNAVGLEFNHALSGIKFTVRFKDERNIRLDSINIHYIGIENKKTYNFATQSWASQSTKSYFKNSECNTAIVVEESKKDSDKDVIFDNINNHLFIIPQEISTGESIEALIKYPNPHYIAVQIAYKIVSGTETSPSIPVETGWMPLPAPKVDKDNRPISTSEYKKGEAYTYNIVVNGEETMLADVTITDQDSPINAFGNIDLGLLDVGITKSEYEAAVAKYQTKASNDNLPHLYYATALRAARILEDGVRDFVVIGNYGGNTNDGTLGYHGSGSSPFFISANSLGMMPEYKSVEEIDENGNIAYVKRFSKIKNLDNTYSILLSTADGATETVPESSLFSIDLRGVYNFPTLENLHNDTKAAQPLDNLDDSAPVIPKYAFRDIALLDEIIFPHGLKAIGDYAFENCVLLKNVDLSEIEHIEPGGFADCINLINVKGGNGALTRIHRNGFDNCENLTTIDLKNVKEVGDFAFVNCHKLTNVDFSKLSKVGESAFDKCYELTLSSSMLNKTIKLTEVEQFAFSECHKLGEGGALFDLTTTTFIGEHAFNECTEIKLSAGNLNNMVTIENNAFTGCNHIGSTGIKIEMPIISTIGAYAFKDCSNLDIIDGLENLTRLEAGVFQNCSNLRGPEAGMNLDNIEYVGPYALFGCYSLTRLSLPKLKDGEWGQDFFNNCTSLKELSLPQLTQPSTTYKIDDNNNGTCKLIDIVRTCKDDLEAINLENLELDVFEAWGSWDEENNTLKEINIASCKAIGNAAFVNCKALANINTTAVRSVGVSALFGCSSLKEINLSSADTLGRQAFQGCSSVKKLNLSSISHYIYEDGTIAGVNDVEAEELQSIFWNFGTSIDGVVDCELWLPVSLKTGANAASGNRWAWVDWKAIYFVNPDGTIADGGKEY